MIPESHIGDHSCQVSDRVVEIQDTPSVEQSLFSRTQSFDYLVRTLEDLGIDHARLDHGELTHIHDLLQDILILAALGDHEAYWNLLNGLTYSSESGFSAISVQTSFGR